MVEKVFISPNRVRAYGNIVNMKTGDDFTLVNSELTVTTDMVDGAEMTVFQFGVEGGISIALVSSASACYVGDNVLLTATVLDDNTPVEAAEVTFKVGETTLGTDETDANGVATYTYAASTVGSFDFTASYQDSTSSVVSVSVNHSYSLSFSQSSYVATGGSATLECTLLEDNVAKSGASITVSGSDGSVYNGITNTNGIASVTVSVSAETIFTATYSNVSDTCTVTVMNYLIYDDATTDNRSTLFGSSISLRNSGTASADYDSSTPCYVIKNTTANAEAFLPFPALEGITSSFKMTTESQSTGTNVCGIALYYYIDDNNWGGVKEEGQGMWISTKTNGTFTETNKYNNTTYKNLSIKNEFIYDANAKTLTINRYNKDDPSTIFKTFTMNIPVTIASGVKWGTSTTWSTTQRNLYNIIVEAL